MNIKNIVKPGTFKGRMKQFSIAFLSIVVLLFGFAALYHLQITQRYDRIIYNITLLNHYNESLGALMSSQRSYFYYKEENDHQEAEDAYMQLSQTVQSLTQIEADRKCYYEIKNLEQMTLTLRGEMEYMNAAMDSYLSGKEELSEARSSYQRMRNINAAIYQEYEDVNDTMLSYGNEVYEKIRIQKFLSLFVLFLATVTGVTVLYRQVRRINNSVVMPVQSLIDYAQSIKQGDFAEKPVMEEKMDKEMAMLTEVFCSIVQQLKVQIDTLEENMEIQKELQESRFQELQTQINPHFMFNTLNMLMENAYLEQADTTAELLKITAKMLRYSLDFSGRSVTLYQEMEELGNYVFIQEQRYGDRIRFEFDLDERFHYIELPALILQPLVENAVVHGVKMKTEDAVVRVQTKYDEKMQQALIQVEDNGCGMDKKQIEDVLWEMNHYDARNSVKVGLGNVNMRLKMYYGERVEVGIESELGKGTRIGITLQGIKGEEYVQNTDCR